VRLKKKNYRKMYKNYAPKGTTTGEITTERQTIERACSFENSKEETACFVDVKLLALI
jgi:hypothetical protein